MKMVFGKDYVDEVSDSYFEDCDFEWEEENERILSFDELFREISFSDIFDNLDVEAWEFTKEEKQIIYNNYVYYAKDFLKNNE